jgi:hypothetical protein
VIFASNKLGFDNFELFLVDIDGKKEPVRVTYSDGFDGLPVPSPTERSSRGRRTAPADARVRSISRSGIIRRHSTLWLRPDQGSDDAAHAGSGCRRADHRVSARPVLAIGVAIRDTDIRGDARVRTVCRTRGRLARRAHGRRLPLAQLARIGAKPLPGRSNMFLPFDFTAASKTVDRT